METVFGKMTVGQQLAISAQGRIARYQATLGSIMISAFPLAWLLILFGCGPASVVIALVATTTACSLGRVWFGWRQLDMSPADWIKEVVRPLVVVTLCAFVAGVVIRLAMEASFLRICVTSLATFVVMVLVGWFAIIGQAEREKILAKIRR